MKLYIWSNYSDLTRPHPKWWFSKGNPRISRKSRLVKYYNLARYILYIYDIALTLYVVHVLAPPPNIQRQCAIRRCHPRSTNPEVPWCVVCNVAIGWNCWRAKALCSFSRSLVWWKKFGYPQISSLDILQLETWNTGVGRYWKMSFLLGFGRERLVSGRVFLGSGKLIWKSKSTMATDSWRWACRLFIDISAIKQLIELTWAMVCTCFFGA